MCSDSSNKRHDGMLSINVKRVFCKKKQESYIMFHTLFAQLSMMDHFPSLIPAVVNNSSLFFCPSNSDIYLYTVLLRFMDKSQSFPCIGLTAAYVYYS